MSSPRAAALARNDLFLRLALRGVPESDAYQGVNGSNSSAWIVGHLARFRGLMLRFVGQPQDARPWEEAVATGAPKAPRPGDLPDLLAVFQQRGDLLQRLLPGVPNAVLWAPIGSTLPDGADTVGPAIDFLTTHESVHVGQIALLQIALGHTGVP